MADLQIGDRVYIAAKNTVTKEEIRSWGTVASIYPESQIDKVDVRFDSAPKTVVTVYQPVFKD